MFDWEYETEDVDGPGLDPFGFLLNADFFQLTDNDGDDHQSGWESVSVLAGDLFGFLIIAEDSILGPGTVVIDKFSGPLPETNTVPEPGTMLLLGSGLVGLGLWKHRKTS